MSFDSSEVIEKLRSFPPNAIYSIAPQRMVIEGFEEYRKGKVTAYKWVESGSVLTVLIRETAPHTVRFSVDRDRLSAACDCSANRPPLHCLHVVCALFMTLRLLSSERFILPKEDIFYLESLKEGLFPEGEAPGRPGKKKADEILPYEIVIGRKNGHPVLSIRRGGAPVTSPIGVPSELSPFVTSYYYYTPLFLFETFLEYLKRRRDSHPIFFETPAGEARVDWDPSLKYEARSELNVIGNKMVTVRALFTLGDEEVVSGDRFWRLAVDLKRKKFGVVRDPGGWNLFRTLYRLFHASRDGEEGWDLDRFGFSGIGEAEGPSSFSVPLSRFNLVQLNMVGDPRKRFPEDLFLRVDGKRQDPIPSEYQYRMLVDPAEEGNRMILRPEGRSGEARGTTTLPLFRFFVELERSRQIPGPLRAQKRKGVLYDLFFKLFSVRKKEEAEKLIRTELGGEDFRQHAVKSAAKGLLKYYYGLFLQPDFRVQFHDGRWFAIPNDKAKEGELYRIPYELFGSEVFKGMDVPNEMSLPSPLLHEKLSLLHARLQEAGIDLFYKGKSISASEWEFSFDARRASGIDWFEVRPEIRCDGAVIDEKMWLRALTQNGMVEKDGVVQILDPKAHALLNRLVTLYRMTPKSGKKEIVRIPRLRILDWVALRKEGVTVRLSDDDEALIERLTRFEKIEETDLPEQLKATLRPYQKIGYDWLAFHYRNRFGVCLADDMGLGKTLQAITLLAGIREGKVIPPDLPPEPVPGPHLVVLPPSLLFNWENEIARFYPDLKVYSYAGIERRLSFEGIDVVLTTYALVRRDIEKLKEIPFHVIIFDEAQAVKNITADTTGAVRQLKGYFKVVMTGTPLENHLGEYYSLIDLALPGLLGEYDEFRSETRREFSPALDLLLRRTRPFVIRRTKEEILKELPSKIETDVYLDLTPQQKGLYQKTVSEIRSAIDDAYRSKTAAQAKIIALTAILRLRQLCVSPRLLSSEMEGPSPKVAFLMDRLKELLEAGHSALVFSQFTSFLDLVEEVLRSEAIPYFRLDGSTATGARKARVTGFQEGEGASVFLLSLKAGGQGLNLTRASYVFHLDPWWNPAVENQASDRAHRIGQKNKVSITRILMRHTIEEKMMALKEKKRALFDAVMGGTAHVGEGAVITKSDFDFLLGEG
ncbi:MAG: DEAD/DEAH box helicase [Candidatus Manganitrophaceae bacterium]